MNTYEADSLVCDRQVQTDSPCFSTDENDSDRISGTRKVGDGSVTIDFRHASRVCEALDTLTFEMLSDQLNERHKLREDRNLVFIIRRQPIFNQCARIDRFIGLASGGIGRKVLSLTLFFSFWQTWRHSIRIGIFKPRTSRGFNSR
jgi:hypothetical protein